MTAYAQLTPVNGVQLEGFKRDLSFSRPCVPYFNSCRPPTCRQPRLLQGVVCVSTHQVQPQAHLCSITVADVVEAAHLLGLVRPVVHHVVTNVLRVLLLQHRQPEGQLRGEQVAVPTGPCAHVLRRAAVRRGLLPASVLVSRRLAVVAVQRLAADRAVDVGVEPPRSRARTESGGESGAAPALGGTADCAPRTAASRDNLIH